MRKMIWTVSVITENIKQPLSAIVQKYILYVIANCESVSPKQGKAETINSKIK
ncbi:MAG: hypothetical protein LBP85_10570 [Prevotellaceae bacterium]|nr:hypothetical protein [Prevotellaceae bacterium]